jgi:hypothetical protein
MPGSSFSKRRVSALAMFSRTAGRQWSRLADVSSHRL